MNDKNNKRIGLIAGNGQFPLIFSKTAKERGYSVFAAAYKNEADPSIKDHVEMIEWLHLGQVKKLIRFFKKNLVNRVVMVGGITKTKMFTDVKPDAKAIAIIAGMIHTHDDKVLRAFAGALEKEGIAVESATFLLPELLAPKGCWTKRKPNRAEKKDMELGQRLAKEIGRLDIGQCIVVGGGSVLAVEAIDGTDATILRGGKLGRGNAVVVKICKPDQDLRFDLPATGLKTVETMGESGATVLCLEAGKAVVFNRYEMIKLADKIGVSIVAV